MLRPGDPCGHGGWGGTSVPQPRPPHVGEYGGPVPERSQDAPDPGSVAAIGVFGGTFDPPHVGHLATALEVRSALGLDRVLLVVANRPWQKVGTRSITAAADRFAMVEAAVSGVEGLEASAVEIERGGDSFTADTLRTLAGRNPGAPLHLVLGADAAAGLHTWERVDEVRAMASLVVVERSGAEPAAIPAGWRGCVVPVTRLDVSSTDLRRRVAEDRPVDFLVPPGVVSCIRDRHLYRDRL
jgi:nicotinate-nucleotide adenylyltransferase